MMKILKCTVISCSVDQVIFYYRPETDLTETSGLVNILI